MDKQAENNRNIGKNARIARFGPVRIQLAVMLIHNSVIMTYLKSKSKSAILSINGFSRR